MGPRKRIDKGEDEKEEQEEQEEQEQEEQEEHGKNAQKKAESKGKGTGAKQAKGSNGVAARSNTFGAGAADHSAHDALPSPSIVGAADPHLRTAVSSVRACAFACACTCMHVHSCVCVFLARMLTWPFSLPLSPPLGGTAAYACVVWCDCRKMTMFAGYLTSFGIQRCIGFMSRTLAQPWYECSRGMWCGTWFHATLFAI